MSSIQYVKEVAVDADVDKFLEGCVDGFGCVFAVGAVENGHGPWVRVVDVEGGCPGHFRDCGREKVAMRSVVLWQEELIVVLARFFIIWEARLN